MIKKQYFYILCLILFLPVCFVSAQTKTIHLGGSAGWPPLSVTSGVTTGEGRFGYESVQLLSGAKIPTAQTDLLLDFENGKIVDSTGNYTVTSNDLFTTQKAIMGKASGASRGLASGIRLRGKSGSVFGTSGLTGPLVLSFWLYPSIASNGEQIFSWRSSRTIQGYPMYQLLTAGIFDNRMEWRFTNIFNSGLNAGTEFILRGRTVVVPEVWSHHTLSYNDQEGLLEYRINGRLEAICYVTSNGTELGTVYPAEIGVPAEIDICPNYTGLIDDFFISRRHYLEHENAIYPSSGGRFESQPLKTAGYNSRLVMLESSGLNPSQTDISYYVRGGDNFYEWTESFPEWIPVANEKPITGISGLYFQVAANLYPDGKGMQTPSISEIVLTYIETEPPPPPSYVTVTSGDGYIDIRWPASAGSDIDGYIVYYGEKPGEYLGRDAIQGVSPLNTDKKNSLRLTGLINGRLYYFAVAAYTAGGKIIGPLSRESYARPLRTPQ